MANVKMKKMKVTTEVSSIANTNNTTADTNANGEGEKQVESEDETINEALITEDGIMDVRAEDRKRKPLSKSPSPIPDNDLFARLQGFLKRSAQFTKIAESEMTVNPQVTKHDDEASKRSHGADSAEDNANELNEINEEPAFTRLTEQPSCIQATMRPYQLEALNWMLSLHAQGVNGILADEMGLGKTLETLSLLSTLKHLGISNGPHLIVVPKSTSNNWMRESERFTPNLNIEKFHGNAEERAAQKKVVIDANVILTTYEMMILEKGFFRRLTFDYVIIDEAHRIKNEQSLLSQVVRSIASKHRLLITGTPLQNNLHELWALLNFLAPQLFDNSEQFEAMLDVKDESQRNTVIQRLHVLLRPFLLRRLKSDVETALLPKIETKLFVGMSKMQIDWYVKILNRDIDLLNVGKANAPKMRLMNLVMQLRKVCNHPYLFQGAEPGEFNIHEILNVQLS
jgi:SWI/SNF-related matrix-associated actin-dependent regulator of chromatin subfamily A member 5